MDRLIAALIKDRKQRGFFDEMLIIWGREFRRTPFREGHTANSSELERDHFPDGYTMWLAGEGIKGGLAYGESDELGFSVAWYKVQSMICRQRSCINWGSITND
jgi:hypothetical protein